MIGETASDGSTIVRAARPPDAAAIAVVHTETWRAAYAGLVPQPVLDGLSVERRTIFWTSRIDDPGESRTWVADRQGRVVGFASTTRPSDPQLPPDTGEIESIYLAPEAWGTGVGRRLITCATHDLVERGFRTAILWVFTENDRARRFYEAGGWVADGTAQVLDIGGKPIEEIRYRLDLRAPAD